MKGWMNLVVCICITYGTLVDLTVHIQTMLYSCVTTYETNLSSYKYTVKYGGKKNKTKPDMVTFTFDI